MFQADKKSPSTEQQFVTAKSFQAADDLQKFHSVKSFGAKDDLQQFKTTKSFGSDPTKGKSK